MNSYIPEMFRSIPILVLKILTFSYFIYIIKKVLFLTKWQTSGRDISRTITNPAKIFLAFLIHIKVINLRKFHFSMTAPLRKSLSFVTYSKLYQQKQSQGAVILW